MANSWGFDGSQMHPPHMSAWARIQVGWATPVTISADGEHTVQAAEQAGTAAQIYKIDSNFPSGEHLLIENRQNLRFDAKMPDEGLAIFDIDNGVSYPHHGGISWSIGLAGQRESSQGRPAPSRRYLPSRERQQSRQPERPLLWRRRFERALAVVGGCQHRAIPKHRQLQRWQCCEDGNCHYKHQCSWRRDDLHADHQCSHNQCSHNQCSYH
jgi:hypothetical protein